MYKTYVFARHDERTDKIVYLMNTNLLHEVYNGKRCSNWNTNIDYAMCVDDIKLARKMQEIWKNGFILEVDFVRTK